MDSRTGWYGKLPTLGDFASRRLAPDLVEALDDWLATGIAAWREREPQAWLDAYLAGPSWRFLLAPGVLPGGACALAGVLMPSVDRVGRYFPLTLLRALPPDSVTSPGLLAWLHRLEDLAVDAMHDDWPVERIEAELERLDADTPAFEDQAHERVPSPRSGQSCWWREGPEGRPEPWLSAGLPTKDDFAALLSGRLP